MKRVWSFLILIGLIISLASATIQVTKVSNFKDQVIPNEQISGTISLDISSENLDLKLTSNQGGNTTLENFLKSNKESDFCTPLDCSSDYSFTSPSNSKNIVISNKEEKIGFVLTGSNIQVTSINFSLSSNFQKGTTNPLTIELFDDKTWKFEEFSNEFTQENWGCTDKTIATAKDSLIGNTEYCELINLSETNKIRVGAKFSGDEKDLRMSVYPKEGIGEVGTCTFNGKVQDYCEISKTDTISAGEYQVCISSPVETNYKIHEESNSPNCGFLRNNGPSSSTKDYAIFAKSAKFSDSSTLSLENSIYTNLVSSANKIIQEKYGGDCSSSCIFPLKFNGISQNINIQNLKFRYTSNDGLKEDTKIYDITETPAKVNFQGILDLSKTNFTISKEGEFLILLGETEILDEEVEFLPAPKINSLSPLNPPAGIPVKFSVDASFENNQSLNYSWNFGDNTSIVKTKNNSATHTYNKTGNFNVTINVTAGKNSTNIKSFNINVLSPKSSIESTLRSKNESLIKITSFSNKLPLWVKEGFNKNLNISKFQSDLSRLSKEFSSAKKDEDYVKIIKELYDLEIPKDILEESSSGLGLFTLKEEINPKVIEEIGTGSVNEFESEYQNAILNWQSKNVKANISTNAYTMLTSDLDKIEVLRTYTINLNSKEDSFFIINSPRNKLNFKTTDFTIKEVLGSTTFNLEKDKPKTIEFYSTNLEELSFYASPSLSTIEVIKEIDETCNFNNMCEEGEDYKTCRTDCKPIFWTIFWIVMAILFVLILYTFVQVWYKLRYEDHLFGDRRTLYNLLMYVYNARNQGLDDGKIRFELRNKGWSGEKITYALNKSHGKSNGLYELIPVDWIISRYRKKRLDPRYTTAPKQQIRGNINKYPIQRGSIRFQ